MAKILLAGDWYYSVSSTGYFEVEFERIVTSRAQTLFPDYYVVPFKRTVESEAGRAKADLALIERNYRKWWVVEVEMAHHSLSSHVIPQVSVLASANYDDGVADFLASQSDVLELQALKRMLKGSQPQVVVVVNSPSPEWAVPLAKYDALLCVVEVFRSERNVHALRMNGDYPTPPGNVVTRVHFDSLVPRLMVVESPGDLTSDEDNKLSIDVEGGLTEWTVITSKDKVWLAPARGNPLKPGASYQLLRKDDGRLELREESR